jgi:hypothetical protein
MLKENLFFSYVFRFFQETKKNNKSIALHEPFKQRKDLLISPIIFVFLALPHLIISFVFGCLLYFVHAASASLSRICSTFENVQEATKRRYKEISSLSFFPMHFVLLTLFRLNERTTVSYKTGFCISFN